MKKLTQRQVMETLQNFTSLEQDYDGTPKYYLHLDENFEPVPQLSEAEYTFKTESGYTDEELEEDLSVLEVESNPKFMKVVKELTEKVNEKIEKWI